MNDVQRRKPWVLLLACLVDMGNSYCYDTPSALKSQLQEHLHGMPTASFEMAFNLLYTVYSVPNIVLPLLGGLVTDRIGPRSMLVVVTLLILVGHGIFAAGNQLQSVPVMLLGRVVFGLGGETISVAQATVLAVWFESNELALANGFALSTSKLATTLNNELSPVLAEAFGLSSAIWAGVIVCALAFLATLALYQISERSVYDKDDDVRVQLSDVFEFRCDCNPSVTLTSPIPSTTFWLMAGAFFVLYAATGPFNNVASSVFLERDYYKALPTACQRCGLGAYAGDVTCSSLPLTCPPSPPFAHPLPLLSVHCALNQTQCQRVPPYVRAHHINCDAEFWKKGEVTKEYCSVKYAAEQAAAFPLSIAPLLVAATAPLSGYLVDHLGHRAVLATGAMVLLGLSHALIGYTWLSLYVPLVLQGMGFSVFLSALWPAVSYCVAPHHVGTAYGVLCAVLNFGLALVPMLVVIEHNLTGVYVPYVNGMFMVLSLLGVGICATLCVVDHANGGALDGITMTQVQPPPVLLSEVLATEETCLVAVSAVGYGT
ncbi:hypothetical protein SPRG_04277 [Saprolegnia parasitica CBS 223.65]|uniref:Lysosomal dipeptide transporter MFSD1 n=1 Tax=Saprolegnia parasitica (strain CBS 223.65) TaxID=695850 RepID=A0A067CK78_SAPPC|nr:hypothetical protein SPRG_04277 [Saprolegnia parasitica CBS 223.65]KDO31139.1 hypothetical protein SPRG_04277 [Saprolegnia parasitica CBS 223.65]|eukprot:XP_012198267.1 hypothetical protein SPRG_04277 [Saprolegnia parasitica CBS 223.65]